MSEQTSWSRGYPVSESYPASWHHFQSPAHLRVICALMGVAWEVGPETPLCIAELGCGTGYTSHMLAAGNPNWQVIGLDYNPAHIAEARSMAAAAAIDNLRFIEADLAELDDEALDRLPEFDLITVHGVWSWVADPVREGVLRLLQRRLKPGGLALVSYNALPGAAGGLGLARLVRGPMQAAGDSTAGVAQATKLVERLVAAQAPHLQQSTWRRALLGEIKGARPGYLMHEFQTEHWRPSFHADVATSMATARCEYVGSATIDENFLQMSLSPAQRELWEEAPDTATRELIFDLCVPRAFRRDLYVRGLRRVSRDAAVDALWVAAAPHAMGEVVLKAQAGDAALPPLLIDSVRSALAEGPRSIGALRALPGCGNATPAELIALLIGSGCAVPLWRQPGAGADWADAVAAARRLNAVAAERLAPFGIGTGQMGLATPALGGGLPVSPLGLAIARLMAQSGADRQGRQDAPALVRRLLPPGPPPSSDVMAELESTVARLLEECGPVWRAMHIV
ncbi:class I SAM-dependent methyltransferase [Aquabacterium sp.]|uniref:class I SAM-dependent methyltransferase n=1 Tax=Aquabacterium sp. TaxID=1872578 RepID=UPI002C6F0A53|nr:class I SAM-dependent methyltransferase [Aquabacterium sp.]HSW03537.1 class I SAM-dependent methyltransferase [Aquabacterium sp.]